MASVKYKKIFHEIWEQNKDLFQSFFLLNNEYDDTRKRREVEDKFQTVGAEVKLLLQEGEQVLCGAIERGVNSKYSTNLADKYWNEVRKYFKYIDRVGVKSEWR